MKVFFDTNVLVSAVATRGLCADLVRLVLSEHEPVIGEVVLAELAAVLGRKLSLPQEVIASVEENLRRGEVVPRPPAPSTLPVDDPDDRWILASAIAGNADVLVTGDQGLLAVAGEAPLRILDPRGFWTLVRTRSGSG
ncbi:MAG TPA: putative toxin-antitoxin system toxin component, PIN family [Candidatus Krumholzibacteria bacterium]|nr:putative toxin-antitoxin system toxin component, PIN family [Candidatus Krumholzibacteria bacterium]HPD72985.1 putative toxin-antitoxin system toxin component, PIN family [Candidatus Krumholzibacteria bacterium]HRY41784.1 putative toxin-antitoxin system toxin component, PIN family [Candidatus Krumholzibacteria bacterium]